MRKPKVTLTVEGTHYVPIKAAELQHLREVEKAARELVARARLQRGIVPASSLRKLSEAVRL